MKFCAVPYQEDLSELVDEDEDDESEELDEESDFFSACLASFFAAPEEAESAFSRRRLAVP